MKLLFINLILMILFSCSNNRIVQRPINYERTISSNIYIEGTWILDSISTNIPKINIKAPICFVFMKDSFYIKKYGGRAECFLKGLYNIEYQGKFEYMYLPLGIRDNQSYQNTKLNQKFQLNNYDLNLYNQELRSKNECYKDLSYLDIYVLNNAQTFEYSIDKFIIKFNDDKSKQYYKYHLSKWKDQ